MVPNSNCNVATTMDPQTLDTASDATVVEACLQITAAIYDVFKTPWTEENDREVCVHMHVLERLQNELFRRKGEHLVINPPATIFHTLKLIRQIDEIQTLMKSWFNTKKDDKKSHGPN